MQIPVTDRVIKVMGMGRVFKDNSARINSIDFHRTEDLAITGADDDSIHIYNVATGQLQETLHSKKYGVSNVCFTHSPTTALYASRKNDHALRYHDLRRNEYLRYFKGHTGAVTALSMNPRSDMFMSAAQDKTVRLWDLRTQICQGLLNTPSVATTAFDQQGMIFAVAVESGMIKLYDARSYDKGPFDTFVVQEEVNSPSTFSDIKFSPDGKLMSAACEGKVYVLDSFTGLVHKKFVTGSGSQDLALSGAAPCMEACFSADNQYILSGCEDRSIRVWNVANGTEVASWQGHAGIPACVKWAPRRLLVASGCLALALWIPNLAASGVV